MKQIAVFIGLSEAYLVSWQTFWACKFRLEVLRDIYSCNTKRNMIKPIFLCCVDSIVSNYSWNERYDYIIAFQTSLKDLNKVQTLSFWNFSLQIKINLFVVSHFSQVRKIWTVLKWQRTESCMKLILMHVQLQDWDSNWVKKFWKEIFSTSHPGILNK